MRLPFLPKQTNEEHRSIVLVIICLIFVVIFSFRFILGLLIGILIGIYLTYNGGHKKNTTYEERGEENV